MSIEDKSLKFEPKTKAVIKRCIPAVLLALFFSFVVSICMLITPLYMINLFDRVLTSGSMATLLGISMLAGVGIIIYGCFDFLRTRVYLVIGRWLSRRLSEDLMEAILSQSLRGTGVPSQTLRDINDIRTFVAGSSLTAGLELIWSPLFFLVLFGIHPVFGVIGVIGGVLLLIIAVANELLTREPILKANESGIETFNKIGNALVNAEAIEAMGILPRIIRRWRKYNDRTVDLAERAGKISGTIGSISRAIRLALQMSTFGFGAVLILDNETSAGTLIAASIITNLAISPIDSLIGGWRMWISVWDSVTRTVNVELAYDDSRRSTMPMPPPSGRIEIDRLIFVPPGKQTAVIKGISFTIEAGETIALVGASAAGKSTLARLIVGIWAPNSGAVRMDGQDVYAWERESFGRFVGYLPQTVELFDTTVRENISRLADSAPEEVIAAAKQANVHEMIGHLANGYDTDIGANSYALTGGQRQRIALARALFGQPKILILDEPDASLDLDGIEALLHTLRVQKERGATILVVTHRPQLLRLADRIVTLNNGMIEKITRPENIVHPTPQHSSGPTPEPVRAQIAN